MVTSRYKLPRGPWDERNMTEEIFLTGSLKIFVWLSLITSDCLS